MVDSEVLQIYGAHSTTDIDNAIRRSEIELPHHELKQGLLRLRDGRDVEPDVVPKVIRTICAIANNGKERAGQILIGVTDKEVDAARVRDLDKIEPRKVGSRFVVGVKREATARGEKPEDYFARWKQGIRLSELSQPQRGSVLSNMDYHDYFGLGLIVITVPPQRGLSTVGEDAYWREGDETKKAIGASKVGELALRFT